MDATPGASGRCEAVRRIVAQYGLEAITDGVLASFANRAEFELLRPPREELRAWVRWNIELVVRWFDGLPPTETDLDRFRELARITAANGTPPDIILGNYRRGTRYAWNALIQVATNEERPMLLEYADVAFQFVDRISSVFTEAYDAAARSGGVLPGAHSTMALLTRLAGDDDLLAEDHSAAERIGFRLGGPFHPFAVCLPGSSAAQHTILARRVIASGALAGSHGRQMYGIANGAPSWNELGIGPVAVIAAGPAVSRGALAEALDELRAIAEIAAADGHHGPVAVEQYLPELLLYRSPRISRLLYTRVYRLLEAESPELTRTLDNLVKHDFDRGRTAASLPVHRNTLTNRIERIRALTGLDMDAAEGQALVWLAWRFRVTHLNAPREPGPSA